MKTKIGLVTVAFALFAWLGSAAAADTELKELNFGIISTESTANLK